MNAGLLAHVSAALSQPVDPAICAFASRVARERGALAVLFYGSNLRSGALDGVLDFYVLLPGARETGLWPYVSYAESAGSGARPLRAKLATLTLATFAAAAAGELRDTTVWSRFVQPSALVWSRDAQAAQAVAAAVVEAAKTAAVFAVALGPAVGPADAYWCALLRRSYRNELRFESPRRADQIVAADWAYYTELLPLALAAAGRGFAQNGAVLRPRLGEHERAGLLRAFRRGARWSKPYNLARLLRAALTFAGAARYAQWKIERHTGVAVTLTPWRERHPLLAAPAVLWRVWRARRTLAR